MNQADTLKFRMLGTQLAIGLVVGAVIACSPTAFDTPTRFAPIQSAGICDSTVTNCISNSGFLEIAQNFKVGAGKVDILFVDDNSASMSFEQSNMAAKFGGFIENLDSRGIDYKIAIITTDLAATQQKRFIGFGNGKNFLTNADSNRVGLFNQAIARPETLKCENFIRNAINSYGSAWRYDSRYQSGYPVNCPSPDERGLYTSNLVISENAESFLRLDANLNVILVSDEDVRSAQTQSFEANDRYEAFNSMMSSVYPAKYWEFNSIVVKTESCRSAQSAQMPDNAVSASIGMEYIKLSNSAARDIDNNPRPRGQILDICQADYAQHFATIATQIGESARLLTLRCKPTESPTVEKIGSPGQMIPFTWDGNQSVVFQRGSEGINATVKYRCYQGVK